MKPTVLLALVLPAAALLPPPATACSTLLCGRSATGDESVLMSHSCDGDVMGLAYVMPARAYPPGTLPVAAGLPRQILRRRQLNDATRP
jgi:hypothetical protein